MEQITASRRTVTYVGTLRSFLTAGFFLLFVIMMGTVHPWGEFQVAHGAETQAAARPSNRLIQEKSPYLLQHAHNPVDWYPWGKEAFDRAHKENKPIFLSIGYSTCHWCHVMERESFEDPEVADLMNKAFISIKVDREERPDLDHIYMTVCQMLTGSGGWPLTIIMTPDKKPFFAGTYIPKTSRFGRLGMMELIPRIQTLWSDRRQEVLESAEKITNALKSTEQERPGQALDGAVMNKAVEELKGRFDETFGGFGDAPKFPTPHNFLFLLRHWKRTGNGTALDMVEKSLEAIRLGGIYDHIGYGFHRYATDREWLVPHFEKMLYDQAMLAMAYLEAFQATGKHVFAATAQEIFAYVLRDMTAPEGGFYSAEDADSEGEEGKFYVWKEEEIRQILGPEEAELIIRAFNLKKVGNFKEEATGKETGTNIPHLKEPLPGIAEQLKMEASGLEDTIASARQKLFQAREQRIHPHKDDKILTDWNGLMIAAPATGARVLGKPEYTKAAADAAHFILNHLRTPDGRLLHRYRDGHAGITAHVDDYSFFIWGLIERYGATFDPRFLKTALEMLEAFLSHYWDNQAGGFFFTPDDGEKLIVRKKEVYDGAIPSGNAVALHNLLRLARYTGESQLEEKASALVKAFSEQIAQMPSAHTQFLASADFAIGPSYEIVIVGSPGAQDTEEMLEALRTRFIPNQVTIFRPSDAKAPEIETVAPFVKNHVSVGGKATAYVCLDFSCKAPTTDIKEMLSLLQE